MIPVKAKEEKQQSPVNPFGSEDAVCPHLISPEVLVCPCASHLPKREAPKFLKSP